MPYTTVASAAGEQQRPDGKGSGECSAAETEVVATEKYWKNFKVASSTCKFNSVNY